MGWAALVAAVVAAAASAYATYQSGQQQAKGFRYQAQQQENQAQAARNAAAVQEAQSRERNKRIMALARARAGASGVVSTEGSPLLVMLENARQAELEAQLIRYGGEIQAGFLEGESRLSTFRGRNARRAGNIGAGTTLLSGVANAYAGYKGGGTTASTGHSMGGYEDSVYGR